MQEFYKDEYELLEYLASGNIIEFLEFSSEKTWITHLKSYGIVNVSEAGRPTFGIDVIRQYVAVERAKRLRTTELHWVVPQEKRKDYLARRIPNLLRDNKMLLRTIEKCGKVQPYGHSTLPEADLIAKVSVCEKWADFNSFVTDYCKALVEPIDLKHGKKFFYNDMRDEYPQLFDALQRIRLLRNNADHLRLEQRVEDGLKKYLERDLMGRALSQTSEPWFVLQQVVIDELFAAIQYD